MKNLFSSAVSCVQVYLVARHRRAAKTRKTSVMALQRDLTHAYCSVRSRGAQGAFVALLFNKSRLNSTSRRYTVDRVLMRDPQA